MCILGVSVSEYLHFGCKGKHFFYSTNKKI